MAQTPEQKEAVAAAKKAEKEAAAAAKAAAKNPDVAAVTWNGGVREFTREIHGDDFEAVAAEFAETHGGKVA